MSGEIKIGMEFGSYDSKIKDIGSQYDVQFRDKSEQGLSSECIFRDRTNGGISGSAYKEKITYDEHGRSRYGSAVLFFGGYQYTTSSNKEDGLDKFDYIQTKNQYALDINGNGKVDDGEVFEGQINREAYKAAKDDGDLSKYQQYKKQFTYDWLK